MDFIALVPADFLRFSFTLFSIHQLTGIANTNVHNHSSSLLVDRSLPSIANRVYEVYEVEGDTLFSYLPECPPSS